MADENNERPSTPDAASNRAEIDSSDEGIGRRIREAREARGLTQQAVSARSKWADSEEKGISRTTLVAYEAGTSRPGTRELRILCETLLVTPNYLVFGSEQPFQASHAGREALRHGGGDIALVSQLALVLSALKGHERDALMSLALSLAGRQLGDARLAGIRSLASLFVSPAITKDLREAVPDCFEDDKLLVPLDELADRFSHGAFTNVGTRLRMDEDTEEIKGEWTYPDPKQPRPSD